MKKGILITCLCVLLLSGCGSSSKDAKAIKECTKMEELECVTKEQNDLLPNTVKSESTIYVGGDVKTGKTIKFINNDNKDGTYDISLGTYSKDNLFNGFPVDSFDDLKIKSKDEFVVDLPKDAIGKNIIINVDNHSGAPELTIEVI